MDVPDLHEQPVHVRGEAMSAPDQPVDTTVDDALALLGTATRVRPYLTRAVSIVDDELRRLRENNTRLGLLRIEAEAKVDGLLALVHPVQDAYARCAGYDHTTDERLRESGLDRLADALSALDALDAS